MLPLFKVVTHSCFGIRCSSDGYKRLVEANGGCLLVVDDCTTVILLLYTVCHLQEVTEMDRPGLTHTDVGMLVGQISTSGSRGIQGGSTPPPPPHEK